MNKDRNNTGEALAGWLGSPTSHELSCVPGCCTTRERDDLSKVARVWGSGLIEMTQDGALVNTVTNPPPGGPMRIAAEGQCVLGQRSFASETWYTLYDLKLSRRQGSIKSSRAISRVRWIKETTFRGPSRSPSSGIMMKTEMVLETSVSFIHLTWLIARKDFIG
jgi:hypothetical protein